MVRSRVDTEAAGDSERHETARFGVDLLLTADRPFVWGRTRVRPGVGAGMGWIRSHGNPDVATPGQQVDVDAGGLRFDAHLTASFPIGGRLSLELDIGLEFSLHAHTAVYQEEGLTLAGEPRGFVHGGLGLRYGAQ